MKDFQTKKLIQMLCKTPLKIGDRPKYGFRSVHRICLLHWSFACMMDRPCVHILLAYRSAVSVSVIKLGLYEMHCMISPESGKGRYRTRMRRSSHTIRLKTEHQTEDRAMVRRKRARMGRALSILTRAFARQE